MLLRIVALSLALAIAGLSPAIAAPATSAIPKSIRLPEKPTHMPAGHPDTVRILEVGTCTASVQPCRTTTPEPARQATDKVAI